MGAIKKLLIGILILVLGHSIYFYGFRIINNPRFDIFYQSKPFPETHFSYFYFLGEIPSKYYKEFDERIVFENNQCKLINILRKQHPNYHNYVIFSNNDSEFLLKNSDLLYSKIQGVENLISSQIDIEVLNKYLKCINITDRDEMIDAFFYLSSTIGEDTSYKADYDPLPSYIPIKNINDFNSIKIGEDGNLDNDNLSFDSANLKFKKDNFYCWFKNYGVFQFNFEIENGTFVNVTEHFLGFTGAEKW